MYCKKCKKENSTWVRTSNGFVCEKCSHSMFVCPSCGIAYEQDDFYNGDAGNGFCTKCNSKKI